MEEDSERNETASRRGKRNIFVNCRKQRQPAKVESMKDERQPRPEAKTEGELSKNIDFLKQKPPRP
ncbi:hypothetical protein BT69DRAFT_448943 [Atractiella rhizophila]|nr:hypothetical protein BT69DRAFT_448943 [Atractiella rhizophila]